MLNCEACGENCKKSLLFLPQTFIQFLDLPGCFLDLCGMTSELFGLSKSNDARNFAKSFAQIFLFQTFILFSIFRGRYFREDEKSMLCSQQLLLGVKTQQRLSIRSSFPFGHLNGLLSRKKTFRQQKLNSAGVGLLGVTF